MKKICSLTTLPLFYLIPVIVKGQLTCQTGVLISAFPNGNETLNFSERQCSEASDSCSRSDLVFTYGGIEFPFSSASCSTQANCSELCSEARKQVTSFLSGVIKSCESACCSTHNCNGAPVSQIKINNITTTATLPRRSTIATTPLIATTATLTPRTTIATTPIIATTATLTPRTTISTTPLNAKTSTLLTAETKTSKVYQTATHTVHSDREDMSEQSLKTSEGYDRTTREKEVDEYSTTIQNRNFKNTDSTTYCCSGTAFHSNFVKEILLIGTFLAILLIKTT